MFNLFSKLKLFVDALLAKIFQRPHQSIENATSLYITIKINSQNTIGGYTQMAITLTDMQEIELSIEPKSARGNYAPVETVKWTSSNEDIVGIEETSDPKKVIAFAMGPVGHAQILVEADADMDSDVVLLKGVVDINVVASDAVMLSVATGTPTEQDFSLPVVEEDSIPSVTTEDVVEVVVEEVAPVVEEVAPVVENTTEENR